MEEQTLINVPTSTLGNQKEAIDSLTLGLDHLRQHKTNLFEQENLPIPNQGQSVHMPLRLASVLLLLRYNNSLAYAHCPWDVLLTLRTAKMRSHRGLVCLPGGKLEKGENSVAGALREAEEEVGLRADDVQVLGEYGATFTVNNQVVYSVIAVLTNQKTVFEANPSEVEDIFWMPLSECLRAENHRESLYPTITTAEYGLLFHYFDYSPPDSSHIYTVWGLTARLLMATASAVTASPPEYIIASRGRATSDPFYLGFLHSKL